MRILAISDVHDAQDRLQQALPLVRQADWVVVAGDITTKGSYGQAARVLACIETITDKILAVHGNMDTPEVLELLRKKGYSLHCQGRIIGQIGFFGVGGSSPTPMHTPTEYEESQIAEFLNQGYSHVASASIKVLVTHVPPRGIRDRALWFLRGGSRSVREFLDTHQVDLCIAGHIHEAKGISRRGNYIVANAGAFKRGLYLWVEIGDEIRVRLDRL